MARGRAADGEGLLEFVVSGAADGSRLDVYLAENGGAGSRSHAAALIADGRVRVDGRPRAKSYRLESGERVEVEPEPAPSVAELPEPEDIPLAVPYEDEWLLIADKPAGMVVHPARGHARGTLVNALLGRGIAGGEAFRPGIVHRLDQDTSGLLLVAKDPEAHRRLQSMIRERLVDRRYLALVHGSLSSATGTIDAPIGRDPARRKTMAIGGAGAREAVTHFTVLERFETFTLVEARLETGRTHQIRVHFLAVGHPVAGDPVYARRDPLAVGRQFLHSHRLSLPHPMTDAPIDVRSPLPPDLETVLERLRGTDSPGA